MTDQVVFLFDKAKDRCGVVLKELHDPEEAKAEVERLRQQGLSAYYTSKSYYTVLKNK